MHRLRSSAPTRFCRLNCAICVSMTDDPPCRRASPVVLPCRGDETIQDIVEDRHRGCEVEPDELGAVRIEGLAGAESDPRLVEKKLEGRGRDPKLAAIEPGEIGGLWRMKADLRRFGRKHIRHSVPGLEKMVH